VCSFCGQSERDWVITGRERALELLARLEGPDGLSNDDALRLGVRLLVWTESGGSRFRCDAATAATDRNPSDGRSA
jgi:hypothetical protein